METQNKDKTYWHDAFFEALQLELHQYLPSLNFIYEHQHSKQALIIDVLVIRKEHDIEIEKNIGKIFKAINLFEFKSEKDSLTVNDYNKVMGYAYLYASSVNANVSDITVSFAVTIYPRNLLAYLENDRKFKVTYSDEGIYYIDGDTFPVQILESKKLSSNKNLFLKNLRSNLDIAEAKRTVDAYGKIKEFESKNAYINRLVGANPTTFEEMIKMSDSEMKERIWKALIVDDGWLEDQLKERDIEKAKNFLLMDVPAEKVAEAMGLPLDMVKTLA